MRLEGWVAGLIVATTLLAIRASADDLHVGWIEEIGEGCEPRWRKNERDPNGQKLDAKSDRHRLLYPGESVRCEGEGLMQVQDHAALVPVTSDWYTLRLQWRNGAEEDTEIVERFGRIGGRPRGVRSQIFSPAPEGVVRPDKVDVRWTARRMSGVFRLLLLDEDGVELWRKQGISLDAGKLDSEELRRVLAQRRDDPDHGPLTLRLTRGSAVESQLNFSVLSTANEKALEDELARCNSKRGLLRSACRAYAFETRRMWNELAEEYDAAVATDPTSRDLLLAAYRSHRFIGDSDGMQRLAARFPPGSKIPE